MPKQPLPLDLANLSLHTQKQANLALLPLVCTQVADVGMGASVESEEARGRQSRRALRVLGGLGVHLVCTWGLGVQLV